MAGRMIIEEVKTVFNMGLVGTISLSYYLTKLGFEKTGYLETEDFSNAERNWRIEDALETYFKEKA